MFYFYKTLKLRLKFVALPFPIFRILLLVYIYIFPIIYSRHTHKRFSCFLVPQKLARNRRTSGVSEKSERAAVSSRRVYLCYATRFGTKCLIFLSVFFFSFFFIHLSFSFYNAKNRDLALASISIVSLLSEIEISKGTSVRRYLRVRTTFYSKYIYRGNRSVASRASHSTHQLRCNVIVEQSLLVLLFPPFYSILDGIAFVFCAEIRFNF